MGFTKISCSLQRNPLIWKRFPSLCRSSINLDSKDLNEIKEQKPSFVGEGLFMKGKFTKKYGRFKKKKGKVLQNRNPCPRPHNITMLRQIKLAIGGIRFNSILFI